MSIIRVTTNILEDYQVSTNSQTPFNPFVIARFPSGPIGQWTKVTNVRELAQFGKIDHNLPTAYAVKDYVNSYRDIYLYRVAAKDAVQGTAKMTFNDGAADVPVLGITTKYATEQLNGTEVSLIKETSLNQIYIKIVTPQTTYRTIGVDYDIVTGTADVLSIVIDKLVDYINNSQNEVVIENLFVNKIDSDPVPDLSSPLVATVEKGNSGNADANNIDDQDVINALQTLEEYDTIIDAILAPEFTSSDVIEALSVKADASDFIYICAPAITRIENETPVQTANRFVSLTDSYQPCKSRVVYFPNVNYNIVDDNGVVKGQVEVPASIAMLKTYAINDDLGKWYAPEGISDTKKRGLLTSAVSLAYSVPSEAAEILYNANNPVNYIQSISGIGIIALGNKTSLSSSNVFSKIHIVRLSKYLHRLYNQIGFNYIGEPIDDFVYEGVAAKLRIELDKIVSARGIEAYEVKCDRENNTEEMRNDGIIYTMTRIKYYNVAEVIENDLVFTNAEIAASGNSTVEGVRV